MMAGIKGKDTKPELVLRREMHARGYRYRLQARNIAGRPDLVFPKCRSVVFVHGCYWHRHEGCRYASTPSTRPEFWRAKFDANVSRDHSVRTRLLEAGWRVATIWECALRKPQQVKAVGNLLSDWLDDGAAEVEIGEADLVAK